MTDSVELVPRGTGERDVTMSGTPVPTIGHLFHAMGPWITAALLLAVGSGAICAMLLNRAYGAGVEDAAQIGWMSAMAVIGLHPLVVGIYALVLFGGVIIAANVERWTRVPALGSLVVLGLAIIPWAMGLEALEVSLLGGLGVIDPLQSELAAANLTDDWWLFGLWFGLTWVAGRHNVGVLTAAVWVVALFAVWQLGAARVEIWTVAVEQVHDTISGSARTPELAEQFGQVAFVMWARSAADFFFFLTPMLAIGMLGRRKVSTMAIERARSS